MSGALDVEIVLGRAAGHQGQYDFHEQDRLKVRLRRDRLGEPGRDFSGSFVGDHVAFAVRATAWLGVCGQDFPVAG
jgi:hypothetical protein